MLYNITNIMAYVYERKDLLKSLVANQKVVYQKLENCCADLQEAYENGNKKVEKFLDDNNITSAVWAYMYF